MTFLAVQVLTGLASASSLFLIAAGLTLIFGVTRIVNFAHGSLFMLGSYVAWSVLTRLPRDPAAFVFGIALTAVILAAIGAAMEMLVLRRVYRAPELLQLLTTFGVLLILQDVTLALWGPADLSLPRPAWLRGAVSIGTARLPTYDLALIAIGPLVLGALILVLTRTRWGVLVRAATEDREMVAALGVDPRVLFTSVFTLGAGLAGLGGALTLPDRSANLHSDLIAVTDAFVVVVVGGLGSIGGAYLASLLIGLVQAFGIVLLPEATLVLVFALMAAVLAIRPHGLLGRADDTVRAPEAVRAVRPAPPVLRIAGAAALLLAAAAPFLVGPYALSVLGEAAIAILFASSLHLMLGPGGIASFGHAAWFGLGAYAAILLAQHLGTPLPLALGAASLLPALAALLFGVAVSRLSGVYLAMLTLAFAQILWALASQWVDLTGGDNGLVGLRLPSWAAEGAVFYWLTLALCIGSTLLLRRVLFAPAGYALRAARDQRIRAEAIGLPVQALRVMAFTLAGAGAGLAGGLFAYGKGSVFPTYLGIAKSVEALVMVLLGGMQTMAGPIVGAAAYTALNDWLLLATEYWRAVLGAAIVLLVIAFPDGIAGVATRLWRRGHPAG